MTRVCSYGITAYYIHIHISYMMCIYIYICITGGSITGLFHLVMKLFTWDAHPSKKQTLTFDDFDGYHEDVMRYHGSSELPTGQHVEIIGATRGWPVSMVVSSRELWFFHSLTVKLGCFKPGNVPSTNSWDLLLKLSPYPMLLKLNHLFQ